MRSDIVVPWLFRGIQQFWQWCVMLLHLWGVLLMWLWGSWFFFSLIAKKFRRRFLLVLYIYSPLFSRQNHSLLAFHLNISWQWKSTKSEYLFKRNQFLGLMWLILVTGSYTVSLYHGWNLLLHSPPQTCFKMLKPRKMCNKVQLLGVWGSPVGLNELINHNHGASYLSTYS